MKVGNFVHWRKCPGHLARFSRNQIIEVQGDRARLRFFATFITVSELELVDPTESERRFCDRYHLPVINDDDCDF